MPRVKRVVCYAVNGAGLGHVTRLVAVGRWLRRYVTLLEGRPPEVIFLTSSESTEVLDRAGFPAFKLPSKTVVRQAGGDVAEFKRLARHFVWHTLGVFSPDLLVVDTFPAGSFDELLQVLDGPFAKALIHRRVKPEIAESPLFQAALGLYDAVVVPHTSAPGAGQACGEVLQIERDELPAAAALRRERGVSDPERLIYVSAGGGGDPGAEAQLGALVAALESEPDLRLLVGAGPLYRGRRLGGPRVIWERGPGVARFFPACDAAVSAAGYNTFHELLYLRVPTLFYAQDKVADDQQRRIDAAAALGACARLTDLSETLPRLRDLMARGAEVRAACSAVVADNGAGRCARLLLGPCYSAHQLAWAGDLLTAELCAAVEASPDWPELLGRVLPRLMPPDAVPALSAQPAFEGLLERLSEPAALEVQRALSESWEVASLDRFRAHFVRFLQGGAPVGLLEVALKKHPLRQEATGRQPWLCALLDLALALSARDERVQQAYRLFPRLVDADIAAAVGAFERWLARRHEPTPEVLTALRVLKLTHRQVTLDRLEATA